MTRSIATGARASPSVVSLRWHLPPRPGAFSPAGSVARSPSPRGIARSTLALAARADIPRVGPGGCFVDHCDARVSGAPSGPLAGLTFAAKDNLDVLGLPPGAAIPAGSRPTPTPPPRTPRRRRPPQRRRLARREDPDGRARVGAHGRKRALRHPEESSRAESRPGRVVVGFRRRRRRGFCDVALGTDTAGSVRVPAGYCGIFGFRPTHGAVSLAGASRWRRRSTSSVCSPPSPAR